MCSSTAGAGGGLAGARGMVQNRAPGACVKFSCEGVFSLVRGGERQKEVYFIPVYPCILSVSGDV